MNKAQNGFAVIETVLIFVIVALIAGTGYYVWNSKQKIDKTLDSSATAGQSASKTTKTANTSTTTTSNGQKYVVITEWGVKAPYSGKLTMHYLIKDNYATFWSDEANTKTNGKCLDYMGAIQRFAPTDGTYPDGTGPSAEQAAKDNPATFTHAGNHYFVFQHSQALCPDVDPSDSQSINLITETNDTVKDLSTKLQVVQ